MIRPMKNGEDLRLVFGSCRISAPHEPPYTLGHDEDGRGLGVDALYATAMRLKDERPEELPHALVLLGDQIYAHKPLRHPAVYRGAPRRGRSTRRGRR